MNFETPLAFFIILVIPILLWLNIAGKKSASVLFSSTSHANQSGKSIRQRMAVIPFCLRLISLILLIVAIARPQHGQERIKDISKGIAIEMLIDRSGSMGAEMEYKGKTINRLDVVKQVFEEFVNGNNKNLTGRPNDLIGIISFARYPDTICPLTLAHGALPRFMESLKLVQQRDEDGTAIGDAIALAAARLQTVEKTIKKQNIKAKDKYNIKSKIIILLTDGENNCGKRLPLQSAELAKKWGIKIYTIGVGGGDSMATIQTLFGNYKIPVAQGFDEEALKSIANLTGGIYRKADNAKSLYSVYKKINEMEKSEIESIRYVDYKEKFTSFALVAFFMLFIELFLRSTIFRKSP